MSLTKNLNNVTVGNALKVAFMPQLGTHFRMLGALVGTFIHTFALIFYSADLLPKNHPVVRGQDLSFGALGRIFVDGSANISWTWRAIPQIIIFYAVLGVIILTAAMIVTIMVQLGMGAAQAQGFGLGSLPPIPTNPDASIFTPPGENQVGGGTYLIDQIFVTDPQGATQPIAIALGDLLRIYSYGALVLAGVITGHTVILVVMETAHHGKMMGNFTELYAPLRLVISLGMLVPLPNANGFNTAQLAVLEIAKWGSGMATTAWHGFLHGLYDDADGMFTTMAVGRTEIPTMLGRLLVLETCEAAANLQATMANKEWYISTKGPGYGNGQSLEAYYGTFWGQNRLDRNNAFGTEHRVRIKYVEKRWRTAASITANTSAGFAIGGVTGAALALYASPLYDYNPWCGHIEFIMPEAYDQLNIPRRLFMAHIQTFENPVLRKKIDALAYKIALEALPNPEDMINNVGYASDLSAQILGYTVSQNDVNPGTPFTAAEWNDILETYKAALEANFDTALNTFGTNRDQAVGEVAFEQAARDVGGNFTWIASAGWFYNIAALNADIIGSMNAFPKVHVIREGNSQTPGGKGKGGSQETRTWSEWLFQSRADNTDWQAPTAKAMLQAELYLSAVSGEDLNSPAAFTSTPSPSDDNSGDSLTRWLSDYIYPGDLVAAFEEGNGQPRERPMAIMALVELGNVLAGISLVLFGVAAGVAYASNIFAAGGTVVGGIISAVAFVIWGAGTTLSVVLPLLPAVRMSFGIMSWLVSIFEAVVAMPVLALAHLRADGQGIMGPMAQGGYLLLLNLFARPVLMVIGFLGSILIINAALGVMNQTVAATLDAVNMDNPFKTVAVIVTVTGIAYGLCNTAFKMIDILPDQVMRWITAGNFQSFGDEAGAYAGQADSGETNVLTAVMRGADRQADQKGKAKISPGSDSNPGDADSGGTSTQSTQNTGPGSGGAGGMQGGTGGIQGGQTTLPMGSSSGGYLGSGTGGAQGGNQITSGGGGGGQKQLGPGGGTQGGDDGSGGGSMPNASPTDDDDPQGGGSGGGSPLMLGPEGDAGGAKLGGGSSSTSGPGLGGGTGAGGAGSSSSSNPGGSSPSGSGDTNTPTIVSNPDSDGDWQDAEVVDPKGKDDKNVGFTDNDDDKKS